MHLNSGGTVRAYRPAARWSGFTALLLLGTVTLAACSSGGGSSSHGSSSGSALGDGTNPTAPSVTTQPQNQSVFVGSTASFSVVASGTAPLLYQWSKNAVPIAGATSASYTTPATVIGDNGASFLVIVSNSAGQQASSAATERFRGRAGHCEPAAESERHGGIRRHVLGDGNGDCTLELPVVEERRCDRWCDQPELHHARDRPRR